jgi:hypothetical protein
LIGLNLSNFWIYCHGHFSKHLIFSQDEKIITSDLFIKKNVSFFDFLISSNLNSWVSLDFTNNTRFSREVLVFRDLTNHWPANAISTTYNKILGEHKLLDINTNTYNNLFMWNYIDCLNMTDSDPNIKLSTNFNPIAFWVSNFIDDNLYNYKLRELKDKRLELQSVKRLILGSDFQIEQRNLLLNKLGGNHNFRSLSPFSQFWNTEFKRNDLGIETVVELRLPKEIEYFFKPNYNQFSRNQFMREIFKKEFLAVNEKSKMESLISGKSYKFETNVDKCKMIWTSDGKDKSKSFVFFYKEDLKWDNNYYIKKLLTIQRDHTSVYAYYVQNE